MTERIGTLVAKDWLPMSPMAAGRAARAEAAARMISRFTSGPSEVFDVTPLCLLLLGLALSAIGTSACASPLSCCPTCVHIMPCLGACRHCVNEMS